MSRRIRLRTEVELLFIIYDLYRELIRRGPRVQPFLGSKLVYTVSLPTHESSGCILRPRQETLFSLEPVKRTSPTRIFGGNSSQRGLPHHNGRLTS